MGMINFNLDFWVVDKIRALFGLANDMFWLPNMGNFIVIIILAKGVITLLDIKIRHKNNNIYGKKRVE